MTWGLGLPLTFSHEALLNFKETSRPTYVTLVGNSEGFGQQRVKVQTGHHGVKYFLPKNADKWAKNTEKCKDVFKTCMGR